MIREGGMDHEEGRGEGGDGGMDLKFCRERASIPSRRERGRTPFADGASVACLREIAAYFRWTSHPFCLRAGGGEGAGAGRGRQRRGRRERRGRDDARAGRAFVPPRAGTTQHDGSVSRASPGRRKRRRARRRDDDDDRAMARTVRS